MHRGGRGGKAGLAWGRFESPPKPVALEVGLLRPFCPELLLLLLATPPWRGALNPGTERDEEFSVTLLVSQSINRSFKHMCNHSSWHGGSEHSNLRALMVLVLSKLTNKKPWSQQKASSRPHRLLAVTSSTRRYNDWHVWGKPTGTTLYKTSFCRIKEANNLSVVIAIRFLTES